jgi:outer membrane protein assembly factor BamB
MSATFVVSLLLLLAGTAEGQVKPVPAMKQPGAVPAKMGKKGGPANPDDPNTIGEFGSVTVVTEKKYKDKLEAAGDFMREKDWDRVVYLLQGLLDLDKEDVMVPVRRRDKDGKEVINWVSIRDEANRMIRSLPKEGMEFYRLQNNQKAADLLKQAKETSDARLLAKVATSYLHTDAGAEAIELLGTRMMDRGDFVAAALYFERLLDRQGADKVSPLTLFKAKLAFTRSPGERDKANAELVSRQLEARAPEGLRLGDRTFSLTELNEIAAKYADPLRSRATIYDWLLGLGGRPDRNAQGVGGPPFLEKAWEQPLFYEDSKGQAQDWVKKAQDLLNERRQALLPALHPVAATAEVPGKGSRQLMVYRSHWGIHAVDIKTGLLMWDADCKWSLEEMFKEPRKVQAIDNWRQQYIQVARPNAVVENSVIGSLSTDGQRVYSVDDLPVPPYVAHMYNQFGGVPQFPWGPEVNEAMHYSVLQAFDLGSGKMLWTAGGRGDKRNPNDPKGELNDSYFLGAPLAIAGKLYVLIDKNQELRLICLDGAKGTVTWNQTLATTKEKMLMDMGRRAHAAPLAYGEGILVCPTNAGAVFGVDFLTHSLLWAYAYRDRAAPVDPQQEAMQMRMMGRGGAVWMANGQMMNGMPQANLNDWKTSAPVIADGKVVFTAPDGSTVDCLNLRDGSKVWRTNKLDSDLYLAGVYAGKALIIGKDRCRAIDLKDGSQAWAVETGMPSGRGVASDNVYYLPLKTTTTAAQNDPEPGVIAIDMSRGAIASFTRSRKKEVPGNLLFYEGKVLSQTSTHVVAYPQLKIKQREVDEIIARNPNDPAGLTERGELRLDGGDHLGAVEDLRLALANNPPAAIINKTRDKLYEAMTDSFRDRFSDAEKYLQEYEAMCNVSPDPAVKDDEREKEKQRAEKETARRKATFLCLVAKGREQQGRLVEAFDYYQKFGALGAAGELVSVPDEAMLKTPPDVWAQGRIEAMVAKAAPEARLPLEKQIARSWEDVQKSGDTEKLRQFVAMFGSLFSAGREARLQLAERLLEENSRGALLEAERNLLLLRGQKDDQQLAARAVEALARLWTRQGLLEDAAYCYTILAREFGKVAVRDGKTGADLFDELATDKRFLPYIDAPAGGLVHGKIRAEVERHGAQPQQQPLFGFEPEGEMLPFFRRHKVALNTNMHQFKLIDRKTNEERWSENLTHTRFGEFMYVWTGQQQVTPRYKYHMVGHIVVLPLAHLVFGIDPVNKKVLWEKSLLGATKNMPQQQQFNVDPRTGQLVILYHDGYQQRLGQMGPMGASYVCLQTRDGLLAVDPVTGRTLWTRNDVSPRSELFGDDEYVYLVELGPDGTPGGSRAFRASDGVSVKVPEFGTVYQKRVRTIGSNILLSENDKVFSLRLYNVLEGKDVWKREFKGGSVVLKSEDPKFAGVIEPDGNVTVIDLNSQQEVLRGAIDPKHIAKADAVYLLDDAHNFYLAINGPKDANNNPAMPGMPGMPAGMVANLGMQPGLMPGSGMRSLPVDGHFYALDRQTGKMRWHSPVQHQQVVLEHFRDMPIVMFTARPGMDNNMMGGRMRFNNGNVQNTSVKSIDKRTGKLLIDEDVGNNAMFHALNMDLRTGKIELLGQQVKVIHYLPNYDASAPKDKPANQPQGGKTSSSGSQSGRGLGKRVIQPVPVQVIEKKP